MKYSKVAEFKDFDSKEFLGIQERFDKVTISSNPNRKDWENLMVFYSLEKYNLLNKDTRVLGVGAGFENTIAWLSHYVGEVIATDIYDDSGSWIDWANPDIMNNPKKYLPTINEDAVKFMHMDGRKLDFPDNSFDAIFSSSSIEHFGTDDDIMNAVKEVHRVLKPGGVAAISTEYKIDGPENQWGWDNVRVFNKERIEELFLQDLTWKADDFLDETISDTEYLDFLKAVADHKYASEFTPHMLLEHKNLGYKWTSVHLTLVKNG